MNTDKHRWFLRLLGVMVMCISASAWAATEIPKGKWSFVFTDTKGHADRPIRVYTYRPQKCDSKCGMVIVLHGLKRTASRYRDYWEAAADRHDLVIAAPEFLQRYWPGEQGYNLGLVKEQKNPEKWTYAAVEHLFDEVADGRKDYVLFGHSAGAQFANRMLYFMPAMRATTIVVANPGWYMWPEWRKDKGVDPYPYSMLDSSIGEAELRQGLQRRVVVMLGEKDTDPNHKELFNSSEAKKQGAFRLERGENYFKAINRAADELKVKSGWELVEVPDVAHSGNKMSNAAAAHLFAKK